MTLATIGLGAWPPPPPTAEVIEIVRYTPFDKDLSELDPQDLATLNAVREGWYVEYKSESIKPRSIAKSLSSFANHYGGWLFFGVKSGADDTASKFVVSRRQGIGPLLESLRNASKDLLHPSVVYRYRVFEGPISLIGMQGGRSLIAVRIPRGADTPYVHNDGRVYVRVGDSSQPTTLTDRSTFNILAQRGLEQRRKLMDRVLRVPTVSKGEENQPFLHFAICSDPYEMIGHHYDGRLSDFSSSMRSDPIPFDNIYSTADGYIARQTVGNDGYNRVFTWEFSRRCHSFVTLPIPTLGSLDYRDGWLRIREFR